jgi:hypothetical protein
VERTYYKIPVSYIITAEDIDSVIKSTDEGEFAVPVVFSFKDEDFGYVWEKDAPVSLDDRILKITPGSPAYRITETLTEQGVFRVNNGVAEYRWINPGEDYAKNAGYIILDAALGQGIKAYDYIVTDALTVEEGQIIR